MTDRERELARNIAGDIIGEIQADEQLLKCKTFSALHDVVDANCLGGLCEDHHPVMLEANWQEITIHAQDLAAKWLEEHHRTNRQPE